MARVAVPLLVLVALAATACGGSTSYSLVKTKDCLKTRGVQVGGARVNGKPDFVGSTSTGGAFSAQLGDNGVELAFGETVGDAQQIVAAYQRFALPNVKKGLPDVLRRYNNVVTLWNAHPQDADLSLVVGCLR